MIGEPKSNVSKVAVTHGLLLVTDLEQILKEPGVEAVVGGEPVEWEAGPYFQDLVTSGQSKGLILIGDEASEEPGSGARWQPG